jgi:hypothetical protein
MAKTPDSNDEEHTSEILRQLAKMQETLNSLTQRLDNIDKLKMCHTRIHADRDRHHESSMKEREENG